MLWTSLTEHASRRCCWTACAARWRDRRSRTTPRRWPPRLPRGRRAVEVYAPSATSARSAGPKRGWSRSARWSREQEVRLKIPGRRAEAKSTLSLVASDAGDGNEHDFVVWQQPRLVAPGRPDLLLRDVRAIDARLGGAARADVRQHAQSTWRPPTKPPRRRAKVDAGRAGRRSTASKPTDLRAWLDYLGIGAGGDVKLQRTLHRARSPAPAATTSSRAGAATRRRCWWPTRPTSTSAFPAT